MADAGTPKLTPHVISVLVENEFGTLANITNLIAARGFNIESLTVGPTHEPSISRITLVVKGGGTMIEQVQKQLAKLIEVIEIKDLTEAGGFLSRELMLIKVGCDAGNRVEILNIGEMFKAKAIDYTPGTITFEIVGPPERLDNFITFLRGYGITEMARSGAVGLGRGAESLQAEYASN